jgi:putative glutamine amidotransferase
VLQQRIEDGMRRNPLVGVPSDSRQIDRHPFQAVGEKYLRALVDAGGLLPLVLPSLTPPLPFGDSLGTFDGLLLTGSPSNIEPHHYGPEPSWPDNLHDPARDASTLPLVHAAIEQDIPLLAVCRGLQEVNVALGGSLHQRVHEVAGFEDHLGDRDADPEARYAPAHEVELVEGGLLRRIAGSDRVRVNSLHGQGIRELGRGLLPEAFAPDGLIEAVRLEGPAFFVAVQWHPEWRATENPFHRGLFEAFATACRQRAASRG